jgi:hypothetical protein
MPDARIDRWSRRIVHPRLTFTTAHVEATLRQVQASLNDKGFRSTPADDGFRAKRRPWLSWLAASPATPCVLLVEPTSPGTVVVDVEGTGDHPAPEKVAEALTDAVRLLTAAGVEVQWDEWEAVP